MRRKREENQKRIYKLMYKNDHTWKEGKNPKSYAQTKLQPKPNQTSSKVTYKRSCSLAKMQTRRRIERETKRMRKSEENESYL